MKKIDSLESEINSMMRVKKEENENKIKIEIEKRSLQNKNKGLELKINLLIKEIDDLKKQNENLNYEIFSIRNEKNSNLDNSVDEKKKSILNNGINLNNVLDEPPVRQNSNIINMREVFRNCNTLKKKFSYKNSIIHPIKSIRTFTRDNSSGSKNSNLSVRVIENKYKNSCSDINGVSKSHIPIQHKRIDNLHKSKNKLNYLKMKIIIFNNF